MIQATGTLCVEGSLTFNPNHYRLLFRGKTNESSEKEVKPKVSMNLENKIKLRALSECKEKSIELIGNNFIDHALGIKSNLRSKIELGEHNSVWGINKI